MIRVGTVEILKDRVYPLDAESRDELGSSVVVAPALYDLYQDGSAMFWLMRGHLNRRGTWRMGDGMFALHDSDDPSGIEVTFPSRRFGPDEWVQLLASPEFADGNPNQRIRVTIASVGSDA